MRHRRNDDHRYSASGARRGRLPTCDAHQHRWASRARSRQSHRRPSKRRVGDAFSHRDFLSQCAVAQSFRLGQVTGGSPKSTGVFYDDSFDRTYFAPGSDCKGVPGVEVAFAENIDVDSRGLDAGGKPGDYKSQIDPGKLPMTLVNGKCVVVYPHDFVRVNNIFEIVKKHGGRTAWSDKHPAYEWLNGPAGRSR
jgi:hypothetical protein